MPRATINNASATPSSEQRPATTTTLKRPEFHTELNVPPWDSNTDIDLSTARKVREFYHANGFLGDMRMQCIRNYDLAKPAQITNSEFAIDLLLCYFPDTVSTFSLFLDDAQHHIAAVGPFCT
jgi:hypothetical protein